MQGIKDALHFHNTGVTVKEGVSPRDFTYLCNHKMNTAEGPVGL